MNTFFAKVRLVFGDSALLRRLGFMVGVLVVFRLLTAVPIPGVNQEQLAQFFANNQALGFFNVFSGGGLSNLSLVMLGVGPFITASIIMQLLTVIFPSIKSMYQEEGEMGRKRFGQYSRLLMVPLAILQGAGLIYYFESQGIIDPLSPFLFAVNVAVVVAGSSLLTWLGELVSEFGIGNGVSLIIFAGIVSSLPQTLGQLLFNFDVSQIPMLVAFAAAILAITFGVVYVSEAERPVPVTYAKRVVGNSTTGGVSTYLPLRLNQAGVIPIIFALSILTFPQIALTYATTSTAVPSWLASLAVTLQSFPGSTAVYVFFYFFFVFVFTYFFTAVTFEPSQMASNLQKNGAFVPGVRPGEATTEYLGKVITRITFVGAVFLGGIAVLPLIIQYATGQASFAIGGTALLILVSVVLDLVRKIDAQVSMREY